MIHMEIDAGGGSVVATGLAQFFNQQQLSTVLQNSQLTVGVASTQVFAPPGRPVQFWLRNISIGGQIITLDPNGGAFGVGKFLYPGEEWASDANWGFITAGMFAIADSAAGTLARLVMMV